MNKPETPARVGSSDVLAAVSLLGLVIWASATIIMMITLKIEWLIVAVCGVPIWAIPLLIMSWQRHKAANAPHEPRGANDQTHEIETHQEN